MGIISTRLPVGPQLFILGLLPPTLTLAEVCAGVCICRETSRFLNRLIFFIILLCSGHFADHEAQHLTDMRSSVSFYVTYVLCLCLGLLCLLFMTYWSSYWRGGFSWDGSVLQFNWHPVLMVSGLVVLSGNAAVVYRVPFTWRQKKYIWKLVHAGLMLLALLLSILGLHAVFHFHQDSHFPNLYSLHSWVGICTVVVFTFQWVLGLAGFLFPCSPLWFRSTLKPIHIWMGKAILILSLTSCISGINEELLLTLTNGNSSEPYNSLPVEAKFANSLGVLIVTFGLVVFGILSKNKWRRPEADNESVYLLLSENST